MTTYIRLVRLTDEGRKLVKEGRSVFEGASRIFEEQGGRIVSAWGTLGSYDFIAVVEAPDDATMMKISALVASGGVLSADTLPAVPMQDFLSSIE